MIVRIVRSLYTLNHLILSLQEDREEEGEEVQEASE